jgi:hypothetical protein
MTVTELAFADDITLMAYTLAHAVRILNAVATSGREAGLEINVDKTKVPLLVVYPLPELVLLGYVSAESPWLRLVASGQTDSPSRRGERAHKRIGDPRTWKSLLQRGRIRATTEHVSPESGPPID